MTLIKLKSSEGTEFSVERNIIERSVLIRNILEDLGESDTRMLNLSQLRDELNDFI